MGKTFVGYINLKDGIKKLKENRGLYLKTRFPKELNCCIRYRENELYYCEKIKNILYEYCDEVFVENTYDIFFDLTKSQYLLEDVNAKNIIDSLKKKIEDECYITVQIAMSFNKDFAKWIYYHSNDQYHILNYNQARKIFGRDICQNKLYESALSPRNLQTLPQIFGEEDQTFFNDYYMASKIAENLVKKIVLQLKEKDYGIRHIQIQFYDSKMCLHSREESLRNFTNVYSEIYYAIIQLLKNVSYQKEYFGMKILLSDFKDYQANINVFDRKTFINLDRWSWFKMPAIFSIENHSLMKKTV